MGNLKRQGRRQKFMNPKKILQMFKTKSPMIYSGLALFGMMFLVYLRTLAPGVYGFDSAELATGVYTQGIIHPTGYPLYLLIGKLFTFIPVRDIAYRLNLMSAFFGAITVVMLYYVNILVINNRGIAWISAAIFGLSNYFWQMSLVAEVYTLHTALLAINLALILYWNKTGNRQALMLFSFLFGLSFTNHMSGILFAPGFAWIIARSQWWSWRNWKQTLKMFLVFLLGISIYLYLPFRAQSNTPLNYVSTYYNIDISSLSGLLWLISGQAYRFFSFGYSLLELPQEIIKFSTYLWRNFLGVGVILGLFGMVRLFKKSFNISLGLFISFIATAVFYTNYRVMDKDTMFLAAYLIWAIFLSEGLKYFDKWFRERISENFSSKFKYTGLVLLLLVFLPGLLLNWQWVDMSKAESYSKFAQGIFIEAKNDALIIAPWSQAVVLEYGQIVNGQRPDIKIINSSRINVATYYELWTQGWTRDEIFRDITERNVALIGKFINSRSVYSLEYDATLAERYEYLPDGSYYRLETRN